MGWLTACLFGLFLTRAMGMPLEEDTVEFDKQEVQEIFNSLFLDGRTGRELDIDNAIETEEGEEKAIEGAIQETNVQEISRFNNYIDAIYKRMNAALRAKLMDPMVLNLEAKDKQEKQEKDKKEKSDKKRVKRDETEVENKETEIEENEKVEDEADSELEHRVGEPKSKQKGNKAKKEKKGKGKNKGMKEKKEKGKKKNNEDKDQKKSAAKQKRKEEKEKAKKEKEKAKKERDAAKAAKKQAKEDKAKARAQKKEAKASKKNGSQVRDGRSRDHGQHHKKHKGGKSSDKEAKGNKKKSLNKGKKQKKSKKDNKGKGSREKSRSSKGSKESKVMGSLAGIATLRRSGDVAVMDEENHKVVTSKFTVGPIQLEVSKTIGQGKSRTVKTARATTDVMTGTMVLKVKPDGSAHVKKVVFAKPEKVDVKGSLSDNKPRSATYLKNSVNRMRPVAAQKILKTARYVLKAPATVKQ